MRPALYNAYHKIIQLKKTMTNKVYEFVGQFVKAQIFYNKKISKIK